MRTSIEFWGISDERAQRGVIIRVLLAVRFEVIAESRLDGCEFDANFSRQGMRVGVRLPIFGQRTNLFFGSRAFFLTYFHCRLSNIQGRRSIYMCGFLLSGGIPLSLAIPFAALIGRRFRWNSTGIPVDFHLLDGVLLRQFDRSRNTFRWNSGGKQKRDEIGDRCHSTPSFAFSRRCLARCSMPDMWLGRTPKRSAIIDREMPRSYSSSARSACFARN